MLEGKYHIPFPLSLLCHLGYQTMAQNFYLYLFFSLLFRMLEGEVAASLLDLSQTTSAQTTNQTNQVIIGKSVQPSFSIDQIWHSRFFFKNICLAHQDFIDVMSFIYSLETLLFFPIILRMKQFVGEDILGVFQPPTQSFSIECVCCVFQAAFLCEYLSV